MFPKLHRKALVLESLVLQAEGLLNVDIAISQQQLLFRNLVKNFIKRDSMAATLLKSHFGMGALL